MSLSIVAAKDIEQAIEILASRPRKAVKDHLAEEPEGVGNFLYDFRAAFTTQITNAITSLIHTGKPVSKWTRSRPSKIFWIPSESGLRDIARKKPA